MIPLTNYLAAVAAALRADGFEVIHSRVEPGPPLHARLTVIPAASCKSGTEPSSPGKSDGRRPGAGPPGGEVRTPGRAAVDPPARITLAWAEDTGWSLTHTRLRATPTPWRYLHSRLIPSPAAIAGFVALVLADTDDIAMLYPAQFRRHTQPLRPVLDALAVVNAPPTDSF